MAYCFTVSDDIKKGIVISPSKDPIGYHINCGKLEDRLVVVPLCDDWVTDLSKAAVTDGAAQERAYNTLKERNASEKEMEELQQKLRIIRYRPMWVTCPADFDAEGKLTRKLNSKHRPDAIVHLCAQAGVGGKITWTASTYEEFVNDRGRVDRTYHQLDKAVGVSVIADGSQDSVIEDQDNGEPGSLVVAMKPHASIRFERSGDTGEGDVRVMLKWIPPNLHWRTLQAAQAVRRTG